ncbi:hypothetical protein F66182_1348 [Fusarium sp. NRRL 66182]|nr:hypothetical protein F66182_1348 [Fusarium sp. NRRL 66182]
MLFLIFSARAQKIPNYNGIEPSIYKEHSQYKYLGCYNETTTIQDSAEERALTGGPHVVSAGNMTVPVCLEFCASNGTQYRYAGLEWSRYGSAPTTP